MTLKLSKINPSLLLNEDVVTKHFVEWISKSSKRDNYEDVKA